MLQDGDSAAIVDAILSLARALGMETTAEGIESEALATALFNKGCTFGQGFLYSEALPADAALAYWLDQDRIKPFSA
jgi:EAL domain-containing protein (putative c-di-GMP-specific phosphodiesterase class I)